MDVHVNTGVYIVSMVDSRSRLPRAERRAQLVRCAATVFVRGGFADVTSRVAGNGSYTVPVAITLDPAVDVGFQVAGQQGIQLHFPDDVYIVIAAVQFFYLVTGIIGLLQVDHRKPIEGWILHQVAFTL